MPLNSLGRLSIPILAAAQLFMGCATRPDLVANNNITRGNISHLMGERALEFNGGILENLSSIEKVLQEIAAYDDQAEKISVKLDGNYTPEEERLIKVRKKKMRAFLTKNMEKCEIQLQKIANYLDNLQLKVASLNPEEREQFFKILSLYEDVNTDAVNLFAFHRDENNHTDDYLLSSVSVDGKAFRSTLEDPKTKYSAADTLLDNRLYREILTDFGRELLLTVLFSDLDFRSDELMGSNLLNRLKEGKNFAGIDLSQYEGIINLLKTDGSVQPSFDNSDAKVAMSIYKLLKEHPDFFVKALMAGVSDPSFSLLFRNDGLRDFIFANIEWLEKLMSNGIDILYILSIINDDISIPELNALVENTDKLYEILKQFEGKEENIFRYLLTYNFNISHFTADEDKIELLRNLRGILEGNSN